MWVGGCVNEQASTTQWIELEEVKCWEDLGKLCGKSILDRGLIKPLWTKGKGQWYQTTNGSASSWRRKEYECMSGCGGSQSECSVGNKKLSSIESGGSWALLLLRKRKWMRQLSNVVHSRQACSKLARCKVKSIHDIPPQTKHLGLKHGKVEIENVIFYDLCLHGWACRPHGADDSEATIFCFICIAALQKDQYHLF